MFRDRIGGIRQTPCSNAFLPLFSSFRKSILCQCRELFEELILPVRQNLEVVMEDSPLDELLLDMSDLLDRTTMMGDKQSW